MQKILPQCRCLIAAFFAACAAALFAEDVDVTPTVADGIAWYDAQNWPVENKAWNDTARYFARLPGRAEGVVTGSVWNLSQHSAGELVRFRTNAPAIRLKYRLLNAQLDFPHMPATGVSGLDLYALDKNDSDSGTWKWAACTQPKSQEDNVELIGGMDPVMRDYMLYLPLYNGVDALQIGVPEGAEFHAVLPRTDRPILYYGTSIAHGGCASRPGNAYTAMLSRRLDIPVLNLGFSGSAQMEPELAELFAELDPVLFVLDASPNMGPDLINARAAHFVQILRDKHPDTPILLVADRIYSNSWIIPWKAESNRANEAAVRGVYDQFIAAGDKNIYFLTAENLIGDDIDKDSTMDSSHLNDLGMYRMTDSLERVIRPILGK
ncbi:MAG: SGNH/GDSL hydrolase family protein [Thermoguttaceae bacterium]|nr:SGNH/GDSL hydrolase family protein [Thermoguttaceae bacterium]